MKLSFTLIFLLLTSLVLAQEVYVFEDWDLYGEAYRKSIEPKPIKVIPINWTEIKVDPIIVKFLEVKGIDYTRLTVTEIRFVSLATDWLKVNQIDVKAINIFTFDEVLKLGQMLENAVKSVRVSHYIKNKDYVALRTELAGVIADDKVQKLIDYMEGKNPAVPQKIEWALWKDAYDITQEIPHGDVFLLIKEVNVGYEKLYDIYFSNHQGKTMAVFSWDVARENYIRQVMYQFIERYENKIYAVIPNYGVHNNIDFKGEYSAWYGIIGNVINWVKSNTNLPVGLTVCQVRDDSDVRFHEAMKDLKYDFVYLWGLHDFNYDFGIEFGEANRWANGRPVILGGFWGSRENPLGILPEAILTDMSYKFPSFIAMRKNEGWMGLHIIGDRWNTILTKCKERGITF